MTKNKKTILVIASILFALITICVTLSAVTFFVFSKYYDTNYEIVDQSDFVDTATIINEQTVTNSLTATETAGLLKMREEEKLARDVYLTLYEKWSLPIFNNIAKSELTHTNAIASLLDQYNIDDPVKKDIRGVYENDNLTDLYNQLVAKGEKSIVDALEVGATVEDLDIYDLEQELASTKNANIIAVYENLQKGSRNHLRSFTQNLAKYNADYTPQYISSTEFKSIVSSQRETGKN